MGPNTTLSEEEEQVLVESILSMGRKGFPVHPDSLLFTVQKIIKESGKNTIFKDKPGRSWFAAFLRRHPYIKKPNSEAVSKSRAAVSKANIEEWFDEITTYLKSEGLDEILNHPNRIFIADETGFGLEPKSGNVLGRTELEENFYERKSNAEKEQITVMTCFSANGITVPSMVIFP